jgi:hypothetical protein
MLAVTLAGAAFTRSFSGMRTRRVAGLLMIVFAGWTALGFLAPHGPGHGAAGPAMPAGHEHPASHPHGS